MSPYLFKDLNKGVKRNVTRFRLQVGTKRTHLLVVGVPKEDSKMKSMPCAFYYSQASSEDAIHFLQKQTDETHLEQTEQPNYLAEGQTPL
eukprot:1146446-Pelagomonas_calceolata.AAC.3